MKRILLSFCQAARRAEAVPHHTDFATGRETSGGQPAQQPTRDRGCDRASVLPQHREQGPQVGGGKLRFGSENLLCEIRFYL